MCSNLVVNGGSISNNKQTSGLVAFTLMVIRR